MLSLGVILIIKSNFGVSVATSSAYVYSLGFKNISFGQWNYISQGSVFLFTIAVLKKLKVKYIFSFVVAYLFGETVDIVGYMTSNIQGDTLNLRVLLYALGTASIVFGIGALIRSQFPILPFDTFVKEFSKEKNIDIGKVKSCFDSGMLIISIVSSFIIFRRLVGINIGTLISALVTGPLLRQFLKIWDRFVVDVGVTNTKKIDAILEYDLLKGKCKKLEKEV